jgi:hypothetical protein
MVILQFLSNLSSPKHVDFLRLTYSKSDFLRIRAVENALVTIPISGLLFLSGNYLAGAVLLVGSTALVGVNLRVKSFYALPTPFSKHPFEFIIGFRISFILILIGYYLTFIALDYHNFYLGVFVILALSLLSTLFYTKPEDTFFVWIYAYKPRGFLIKKIKTAISSLLFLCLPTIISLSLMKPEGIPIIILAGLWGIMLVSAGVLSKYTSFPDELTLFDGILLLLSAIFPVLLFFTLPYFYHKAIKQLEGVFS